MTLIAPAGCIPPLRRYSALVLVGIVAGVMAGAFGVGGGLFMVPLLIWMLRLDHRQAVATSLAAIVPTALAAGIGYLLRGEVNILAGCLVAVGGIVGSLIGTRLLKRLPMRWLQWLFIAFMVLAALRIAFYPPERGGGFKVTLVSVLALMALGLVMGVAGGLFGIGGGIIAVPAFIIFFDMGDLLAKGTSLLAMIPAAVTGSASNLRASLVLWLDALIVGLSAVGASFAGVALAFWLNPRASSIAFAVLVIAASLQLTVRAVRHGRGERVPRTLQSRQSAGR